MANRLDLHEELVNLLGNRNVYFQPPASVVMKYPCIVYEMSNIKIRHADNKIYANRKRYSITLIHKDPDTDLVDKLSELSYCSFDRSFSIDNLNHWVFSIFY